MRLQFSRSTVVHALFVVFILLSMSSWRLFTEARLFSDLSAIQGSLVRRITKEGLPTGNPSPKPNPRKSPEPPCCY